MLLNNDSVHQAYRDAFIYHGNQVRKGTGVPYLIHVLGVAEQLALWGISREAWPQMWCAAMLHDVIEDNPNTSITGIKDKYGRAVSDIVADVTFIQYPLGPTKQQHLDSYGTKCIRSVVLKLADRYRNVVDFSKTDYNYAGKYLKKADKLTSLIIDRRSEIKATFGDKTCSFIFDDFVSLSTYLGV